MNNILLGISRAELKKIFRKWNSSLRVGIIEGEIYHDMWTGYKIESDYVIWIKELQNSGRVIAKAKIVSEIRTVTKNGEEKAEFDIKIIEVKDISTQAMWNNYGIAAGANYKRWKDE